jgi:replicative DNA helicase
MNDRATEGRLPPHNLNAEASVLAAAMISGGTALDDIAGLLAGGDFYSEAHRRIFDALVALRRRGKPTDTVLVGEHLRAEGRIEQVGGLPYLTEILNAVPDVASVGHYAEIIRDTAKLRRIIASAQHIAARGYLATGDIERFANDAERELGEATRSGSATKVETAQALASRYHAEVVASANGGTSTMGLPTGFRGLDALILGLRPKRFHILAARPAIGKTAFAVNIAQHITRPARSPDLQQHAVFFTLEMPSLEVISRAIAADGGVDGMRTVRGQMDAEEWRRFSEATGRTSRISLHVCDDAGISVLGIAGICRRVRTAAERAKGRLALVVVDYLQLVSSDERRQGDNRENEVSRISRGLKRLAMELDCAVIALSQLNRAIEARGDGRPRNSDLRESGSLEQDADVIMFIHRPAVPKLPGLPRRGDEANVHEIIVRKARGGKEGIVRVAFEKQFTRFANIKEGADAPEDFDE